MRKISKPLLIFEFSFISFDGIWLRTNNIIPPPFDVRSSLYGSENPSIKNCEVGNVSSILVSEIIRMSILPLKISTSCSNLFLKELMFKYPNIILRGFSVFNFCNCKICSLLSTKIELLVKIFDGLSKVLTDSFFSEIAEDGAEILTSPKVSSGRNDPRGTRNSSNLTNIRPIRGTY